MAKRKTAADESTVGESVETPPSAAPTNPGTEAAVDPFAPSSATAGTQPAPEQQAARRFDPVRSWSERYAGDVRYEVLTDNRLNKIIIKFKLPEGQKTPPDDVLSVMRTHKTTTEGHSTGLRFEDSRLHGKAWTIPNDSEGRALAATIEAELEKVATKATATPQQGA
jgi:hypothetical protein